MDVTVRAESAGGGVNWTIDGHPAKGMVHNFPKDSGKHNIHYRLVDDTELGLRFDANSPFCDEKNPTSDCPANGASSDQSEVISCAGPSLVVQNKNTEECTVRYKLRFLDKNGQDHEVDPDWKNGGTSIGM